MARDEKKNDKKSKHTIGSVEEGFTAVTDGITKLAFGFGKGVVDLTSSTVDAIVNPSTIPDKLDKAFDTIAVKPTKRTVDFFEDLSVDTNNAFKKRVKEAHKGARRLKVVFAAPIMDVESSIIDEGNFFKKADRDNDVIGEALKDTVVFAGFSEKDKIAIIDAFEPITFKRKSVIVKQGDPGDYFYIIDKGEVSISVDGKHVGTVGHGKTFGELALLYDAPRAATCIAKTECGLFRVDQATFKRVLAKHANDEDLETIGSLKKVVYFQDMETTLLRKIACNVKTVNYSDGEVIIKKGDSVHTFYIIDSGKVKVTDVVVGGAEYKDAIFESGETFGERMLMENSPSPGTVTALGEVTVCTLNSGAFLTVCGDNLDDLIILKNDKLRLKSIPFGNRKGPADNELDLLASRILGKTFPKGHVFFKEGQKCIPSLYMIRKGKVSIRSASIPKLETLMGWELGIGDVKEINAGGYFGNDTLGHNEKGEFGVAKYTVVALEDVKVGVLDLDAIKSVVVARNDHNSGNIGFNDLEKVRILGAGTFGKVWLVSRKGTPEAYALKVQVKKQLIEYNQAEGVIREKDVMAKLDHPFIIRMVNSYKDDSKLYMLLTLYQGGELQGVIHTNSRDGVPEAAARFYAAGVIEGLSYMHNRHVLYRDLKPENVLLDSEGYTVIVDLGFAKVVKDKTYTFCGTPLYLAPEIITQKGHDKGADHWSWGVMLYEMIVGMTPFYDGKVDQMGLFKNIVRERYEFPEDVKMSAESKDLIAKMLKVNPNQRLGSSFRADKDIRSHPWFSKIDWKMLVKKQIQVPFKPNVSDPLDGSNFDDFSNLEAQEKNEKVHTLTKAEQSLFDTF